MNKRARHREKLANIKPDEPRQPFWLRPALLLWGAATGITGIVASAIIPDYLTADLSIMREIPYTTSLTQRAMRVGEERQVLRITLCVKNTGFRSGRIKRAVISRGDAGDLYGAELLRIDQDEIAGRSARPVEIRFMLTSPYEGRQAGTTKWQLTLYDDADEYVGDVDGVGEFQTVPDFSQPQTVGAYVQVAGPNMCTPPPAK
jgi:hypothetical protein